MVVLVLWKSVVDQQSGTARKPCPYALHPAFGLWIEFRAIVGQGGHAVFDLIRKCRRGGTIFKLKMLTVPNYTTLHQLTIRRPGK